MIWHERSHRDHKHGWMRSEMAAATLDVVRSLAE